MFVNCNLVILESLRVLKKIARSPLNTETAIVTSSGKVYPCDVGYLIEGLEALEVLISDLSSVEVENNVDSDVFPKG